MLNFEVDVKPVLGGDDRKIISWLIHSVDCEKCLAEVHGEGISFFVLHGYNVTVAVKGKLGCWKLLVVITKDLAPQFYQVNGVWCGGEPSSLAKVLNNLILNGAKDFEFEMEYEKNGEC